MRKAEEILRIFKENNITSYQLGRDLKNISQVTALKFINGETKKPYKQTLELYNSYIDNNFKPLPTYQLTEEKKAELKEAQSSYKVPDNFKHLPIDDKLNTIYELVMQNSIELEVVKRATELLTLNAEINNIASQKKPENK